MYYQVEYFDGNTAVNGRVEARSWLHAKSQVQQLSKNEVFTKVIVNKNADQWAEAQNGEIVSATDINDLD